MEARQIREAAHIYGSQVSGNIKALYADFNTKVRKGQLVAQIDPEIFQAQMDAASATVNQYEASVASADAQLAKATSDIAAVTLPERVCRQSPREITRISSTFRSNGDARKDFFSKVLFPRKTMT